MNERKEYSKKPQKCPSCGSNKIANIQFGYPAFSSKLESDINEGKIVLAGCCISLDDPEWQCSNCHAEYFKKKSKIDRDERPEYCMVEKITIEEGE